MEWVKPLLEEIGVVGSFFILLVLGLFFMVYKLVMFIIDKQNRQIELLAKENHQYRDYFMSLQNLKFKKNKDNN